MNVFQKLIAELAQASGLPLEADKHNTCSLESDNLIITLQYREEYNDIYIFCPVTDPDKIAVLNEKLLRHALALSLHGIGTGGNFLGLMENDLILSTYVRADDLSAEKLSETIFLFREHAVSVRDSLVNNYGEPNDSKSDIDKLYDTGLEV